MNSAYSVGASFVIENLASPEIGRLSEQLVKLDGLIEGVKTNLKTIVPATLSAKITSVGAAFDALPASAEKAASGMIVALGRAEVAAERSTDVMRLRFDTTFAGMDLAADKAASGMISAMSRAETGVSTSAAAMKGDLVGMFGGMDAGLIGATDVITQQFSRITRSANRSSRAIGAMRSEIALLSGMANTPLPQLPGSGGGGGGGHRRPGQSGGGSGGFHYNNNEHINTPIGRVGGSGWGGAAIAGAVVVGDAVLTAAELEDFVTKIIITSQLQPGEQPLTKNADGAKIKDLIQKGAVISGFSQEKVGEMFLGAEREFQGMTFDKKMDTMSILLPAIAAEAHLRHESLEEAGVSLVGVLHQAGLFSQEEMLKGAKEFQFATMATPVELGQFKNALSYTMTPLHNGIGMDTGTIMLLTSLMQSAGISNSKAGTWSRQMFVEAEPSTDVLGPLTKTQVQHNQALNMLGLTNADGKQNWKVNGEDGKTDWNASVIKMFRELHEGIQKIPEGQRADVLHRAFGTQGAGAATLFSQPNIVEQMEKLVPKLKAFQGGDISLQEYSQGSTIQQSRIAMQEFQVLMADLGTKLLPPLNTVLKEVSNDLRALPADWEATKKMWGDRLDWLAHPFGKPAEDPAPLKLPGPEDSLMQLNAYHTNLDGSPLGGSSGGVSDATRALEDVVYRGTLHALLEVSQGSSGGATAVSYGGGGLGGGGGGGGGGGARNMRYGIGGHSPGLNLSGGDATGEHADFIRSIAEKYHIDPRVAVAVAASEGLHASYAGGDQGTSFGDFQMHFGGSGIPGMNGMGLGDAFNKQTGLDAKDPKNWKAVDEWALKYASTHGWGDWHGAGRIGLHGMAGIGGVPAGGASLGGGDWHGSGGTGAVPGTKAAGINPLLNAMINRASEIMGTHLGIVSGLRSEAENIATGGAEHSLHMKGWAADLTAEGHGKSDGPFWRKVNQAFDQASAEMGQPHRWGGTFGGRYTRDNNHFDLTQGGPVGSYKPKPPVAAAPAPIIIEHKTVLDGKVVARSTMKHFASSGRFPNAMGGPDPHSHYVSPGTPVTDAA